MDPPVPGAGTFGYSVSGGGDTNGDRLSDFVVGARTQAVAMPMMSEARAIMLYLGNGSAAISAIMPSILFGTNMGAHLGHAARFVGDVNGDGLSETLAGAPDTFGMQGSAVLVMGTPTARSGWR